MTSSGIILKIYNIQHTTYNIIPVILHKRKMVWLSRNFMATDFGHYIKGSKHINLAAKQTLGLKIY